MQCDLVCEQQPWSCGTDGAKIAYLVGLLWGNDLAWATAVKEQQSTLTTSYSAFTVEMRKVFFASVQSDANTA